MVIDENVRLIVIDSFCGAGGVTEGFHRAKINGINVCKVIVGINHDSKAIESHAANHPETIHFIEDFTTLDANKLLPIVESAMIKYPNAKLLFWASAECTHHSKAKGGMPRDADSRSLPEHIERYANALKPYLSIIGVENVVEFIDWGPLDESGKPIKDRKGEYYKEWRDGLINLGFEYEYRKMNAADYGAYTSRLRYFGLFSTDIENIDFPRQTHSKHGDMFTEKWKAVKDVLKLDVEGDSIFERKTTLVDATLLRIIAGIERFVIGSNIPDFMLKYNSMNQQRKYKAPSMDEPSPTVSCQDRIGVVKTKFMVSYNYKDQPRKFETPFPTLTCKDRFSILSAYYGNGYNSSIEEPAGTVTTKDRFALVTSKFIANQYSGGGQLTSMDSPNPAVLTVPKQKLVSCVFMDQQYGMSKPVSVKNPAGTLTANPKLNLVSAQWLMDTQFKNTGCDLKNPCPTITANRKHFYLMNPQFSNKGGDINKPCFTLIARMDKMPPYLIEAKNGNVEIKINYGDSDTMIRLKTLCNEHGIVDIRMRMLMIEELLRIQGFGDKYILKGTKADMKKFIGNAVECTQAKVLAEAVAGTIMVEMKMAL